MPNLRGTRQRPSRTSSPFVRTANTSPAPTSDGKKPSALGPLDAWVEPAPRSPVPSFADHGMERTALFADMAPLGAMPPQRLKLKIKGDVARGDKAESASAPASDVDVAAMGTPEGTPPVEVKSSDPAEKEAPAASKEPEKEAPVKAKEETKDVQMIDVPPPPPAASTPVLPPQSPMKNGTPTPAHSRHGSTSTSKTILPSPSRQQIASAHHVRDEKMRKVVLKAIEMAHTSQQPKLANVISTFYEETHTNPALATLFDAVITKTETEAQKVQFQVEMKRIRKLVGRHSRQGSRSRTMSSSAPAQPQANAGYSAQGQPATIGPPHTTMGGITMGSESQHHRPPPPLSFQPHLGRPAYSPNISNSPSPFTAFRGVLQPSPFSPTHSHPGSPTYPTPHQTYPLGRLGPAPPPASPRPAQQQNNSAPAPTPATSSKLNTPAPLPPKETPKETPAIPSRTQTQPPSRTATPSQPQSTMAISTRRSARAANSDLTAPNANAGTPTPAQPPVPDSAAVAADAAPTTNGTKKDITEDAGLLGAKIPATKVTKSPRGGKNRRRRSPSADSMSSLSSVDEHVVEKGAPPVNANAIAESVAPSRAVSRSATPRPGLGPKAKSKAKGSNLKNLAGSKRGASETIAIEEADEETKERRTRAKANFDKQLQDRKAEQPPEPDFTSYRESDEYLSALPDSTEPRSRRSGRRQSAPDTSKVTSTRTSTAAATPAPSAIPESSTGGRRARQSTQNQRLTVDVLASAPRLEIQTPSTPRDPPSDAESNGDPPPKRRKTARTKFSPVKLPNGVAPPTRKSSPSRSSPFVEFGREGKKPNRDQCFACGCGGELICCDMCQNSFHAECWDPPCSDANDEAFMGFEWICTHCRIFDKRKENEERSKKGEPMLIDTSDEESDLEADDDVPTTPPDWTLVDQLPLEVPLFKQLTKGFKELLPMQFGLKPMVRDAYDGYVVDTERRFRPTQKAPITVDSRMKPTEAIFDEGKQIKDPKDLKQCVYCGLSAVSKKGDLIKCDTCGDFWHTDCLPTPTTAPPQTWSATEKRGNRLTDVFKKRYWECPRHVDQDMVLLTDPNYYAGNPQLKRGIKVRLPRKQVQQVAAIKAGIPVPASTKTRRVRETPADVMNINVEVDDSWWEKYDARKNELKESESRDFTVHENNILADFAAKAMSTRVDMASSNDELIDALCPNAYKAAHLKKAWHDRSRLEIEAKVAKEVEVTMTLTGMRQQANGIDINDLLAKSSDEEAVDRLAGFMTQDQIKQLHSMLDAVAKKMRSQPEKATAQKGKQLDDDMDTILAGGSPKTDVDEPRPKRQRKKKSGTPVVLDD